MFIDAQEAAAVAEQELWRYSETDPSMAGWGENAAIGEPILVHDLSGEPSYWLVPVSLNQGTAGFIRVMGTGRVAAVGQMGRAPAQSSENTVLLTGVTAEEASRMAAEQIDISAEETASEPVFVHDGPPGREAWLVEVSENGIPTRWLFITQGGVYERPAGTGLDPAFE